MNNNLSFHASLVGFHPINDNDNLWEGVTKKYEDKEYAASIRECIRFIQPDAEKKYANPDKTEYSIPHGSITVNIKIADGNLSISAPFLDISEAKQVPVLRQVAQINFLPLILSRIDLQGNQLYFNFSCPLDLCEPYKVYDVLREICINADNYDDEFITKFSAKHIKEPKIEFLSGEQVNLVYERIQSYIAESLTAYEQLENKRLDVYLWDILINTLLKIDYYCVPQGNLRNELEKTISYLNSKDEIYQRLTSAKDFLKKLQTTDKEKLAKDLYKIEVFVPYKYSSNLDQVRNNLKYAYETSEKEMKANDNLGATFTITYGILNLFYNYNVEATIATPLVKAMEDASGKPLSDATKILYDVLKSIMMNDQFGQGTIAPPTETAVKEEKGFFKKLFGL